MSRISDRLRTYVNDKDVSDHYGAWGILRQDQRRQIRELCDTCDMFERTADEAMRMLMRKQSENAIELPCKVGDTVYQTDGEIIYELEILDILLRKNKPYYGTESIDFDGDAIGKSVFLTREEAEAKMKSGAE